MPATSWQAWLGPDVQKKDLKLPTAPMAKPKLEALLASKPCDFDPNRPKRPQSTPPTGNARREKIAVLKSPDPKPGSVIVRTDFEIAKIHNEVLELATSKTSHIQVAPPPESTPEPVFRKPYPPTSPRKVPPVETPPPTQPHKVIRPIPMRPVRMVSPAHKRAAMGLVRPEWSQNVPAHTAVPAFEPQMAMAPFNTIVAHPLLMDLAYGNMTPKQQPQPKPAVPVPVSPATSPITPTKPVVNFHDVTQLCNSDSAPVGVVAAEEAKNVESPNKLTTAPVAASPATSPVTVSSAPFITGLNYQGVAQQFMAAQLKNGAGFNQLNLVPNLGRTPLPQVLGSPVLSPIGPSISGMSYEELNRLFAQQLAVVSEEQKKKKVAAKKRVRKSSKPPVIMAPPGIQLFVQQLGMAAVERINNGADIHKLELHVNLGADGQLQLVENKTNSSQFTAAPNATPPLVSPVSNQLEPSNPAVNNLNLPQLNIQHEVAAAEKVENGTNSSQPTVTERAAPVSPVPNPTGLSTPAINNLNLPPLNAQLGVAAAEQVERETDSSRLTSAPDSTPAPVSPVPNPPGLSTPAINYHDLNQLLMTAQFGTLAAEQLKNGADPKTLIPAPHLSPNVKSPAIVSPVASPITLMNSGSIFPDVSQLLMKAQLEASAQLVAGKQADPKERAPSPELIDVTTLEAESPVPDQTGSSNAALHFQHSHIPAPHLSKSPTAPLIVSPVASPTISGSIFQDLSQLVMKSQLEVTAQLLAGEQTGEQVDSNQRAQSPELIDVTTLEAASPVPDQTAQTDPSVKFQNVPQLSMTAQLETTAQLVVAGEHVDPNQRSPSHELIDVTTVGAETPVPDQTVPINAAINFQDIPQLLNAEQLEATAQLAAADQAVPNQRAPTPELIDVTTVEAASPVIVSPIASQTTSGPIFQDLSQLFLTAQLQATAQLVAREQANANQRSSSPELVANVTTPKVALPVPAQAALTNPAIHFQGFPQLLTPEQLAAEAEEKIKNGADPNRLSPIPFLGLNPIQVAQLQSRKLRTEPYAETRKRILIHTPDYEDPNRKKDDDKKWVRLKNSREFFLFQRMLPPELILQGDEKCLQQ